MIDCWVGRAGGGWERGYQTPTYSGHAVFFFLLSYYPFFYHYYYYYHHHEIHLNLLLYVWISIPYFSLPSTNPPKPNSNYLTLPYLGSYL